MCSCFEVSCIGSWDALSFCGSVFQSCPTLSTFLSASFVTSSAPFDFYNVFITCHLHPSAVLASECSIACASIFMFSGSITGDHWIPFSFLQLSNGIHAFFELTFCSQFHHNFLLPSFGDFVPPPSLPLLLTTAQLHISSILHSNSSQVHKSLPLAWSSCLCLGLLLLCPSMHSPLCTHQLHTTILLSPQLSLQE